MQVTAAYAKANFAELLLTVANGETVQITRYNKLVASLIPNLPSRDTGPKLGTAPSSVQIIDPDWADPLTPDEMELLFGQD